MMTENALTYLRLAPKDWANHPDQFAIKVYTAIELFLKARLLSEHWSLIITKDATLAKFRSGDFVSVPFEEAAKRLKVIVDEPLPDSAHAAFDELRKYRNKVVHFGLENPGFSVEQIARDTATRILALDAWRELQGLIHGPWSVIFEEFGGEMVRIEGIMSSTAATVGPDGRFRIQKEETEAPVPRDWFAPLVDPAVQAEEDRKLAEEDGDLP